jgi:hypothetical protein
MNASAVLWGVVWIFALIQIASLVFFVNVGAGFIALTFALIQLALAGFGWTICRSRGRGGAGFLLGFAMGSIGVVLASALPSAPGRYQIRLPPICRKCYELLAPGATACPHCDELQ